MAFRVDPLLISMVMTTGSTLAHVTDGVVTRSGESAS